ncbi:tetraacyldisaccharide 4'-kinase [Komagataeibacter xylinus]|uniref:Tetraacyldisaccharide 4'-kinase n=1 Tax=Komagataeibacter xylinus TaxID=28448 RepID=A0A857FUI0_KOMXY|nr:tetraacyldisaccharide 4'-kinase [Komagataeibacter xylinus]QHC36234.1 tetraacyldisaccharide 4'-kinase [Komagataeibacter xylinus]
MQPPAFWWRPATDAGLMAGLLAPLAHIYATAAARRLRRAPWHAPVPVLCCGNIGVGGAGKTPLVMDLARRTISRGRRPAFLSRGYGGRAPAGTRVDPNHHTARDVGDEPLLLARIASCYVGADRSISARRALADGADCLLMDDGFQNPTLHQDLALVVVDGTVGFGNGRVLPAGPLREPVATGLARAGGVVIMGHDQQGIAASLPDGLPCFAATLQPDTQSVPRNQPIIAFAGIGRPAKFFEGLAQSGIRPASCLAFPDHHAYTAAEQAELHGLAVQAGACLVTTQKDEVRLNAAMRTEVRTVGLQLAWANPAMPERILDLWLGTTQR